MAKKFITGFCLNGFCEGTSPVDRNGTAMMVCTFWAPNEKGIVCSCRCHEQVTQMFKSVDMPRIAMQNPHYSPPHNEFTIPTPEERIAMHIAAQPHPERESRPTEVVRIPHYQETPTGKRARGQLEDEVLLICSQFTRGELEEEMLTPATIAKMIDDLNPPSVGAIGAVFERWEKIGFAHCPKKPVRFESFTADGLQYGLAHMKSKVKLAARADKSGQLGKRMGLR